MTAPPDLLQPPAGIDDSAARPDRQEAMHLTHPANTLRGVFTVAGRPRADCSRADWDAGAGDERDVPGAGGAGGGHRDDLDRVEPAWALRQGGDEPEHR